MQNAAAEDAEEIGRMINDDSRIDLISGA